MSKLQDIVVEALEYAIPHCRPILNYRPDWLNGMEIDIFFPKMNLCIEVQGRQHYLWCPELQPSVSDFKEQAGRDRKKREMCEARGLNIMVVKCKGCKKGGAIGRLTTNIKRLYGQPLKRVPPSILQKWRQHLKYVDNNKYPSLKTKRGGTHIPTNKFAKDYMKEYILSKRVDHDSVASGPSR